MNILYTCDNNYVWLMGISMLSLFDSNKQTNEISVYLLGENITNENKILLKQIADRYQRKCIIIDIPDIDIPASLMTTRWPRSAFSRLYAAELLPTTLDRILYLDCDTVILGPLEDLENKIINEFPVYGVKDCVSVSYRKNIGLDRNSIYINAGVLLMNLDMMRKINISELIECFLKNYSRKIHYADQDVLNGMFKGKLGVLSPAFNIMTLECTYKYEDILKLRSPFNFYSKELVEQAVINPIIVHYTTCMTNVRPWFKNSNHPYATKFLWYKKLSPWSDKNLPQISNKKNTKIKLFKLISVLPHNLEIRILGIMHTLLFPIFIRLKASLKHRF